MSFAGDLFHFAALVSDRHSRRYARRWWRFRSPLSTVTGRVPWLVFDAIDALAQIDLAGKSVFEFGSGGSTLYWLDRGARCVSIEHDRPWFETLRQIVPARPELDYRLIEPETTDLVRDIADPWGHATEESPALDFRRYCETIDAFPDESFAVVLVDGRARPSCIRHAAGKVARGGLLILDNAEREYYLSRTSPFLSQFEVREYFGPGPNSRQPWVTHFYRRRI